MSFLVFRLTVFFSLVFFNVSAFSKLPTSNRVLLTLKGENIKENLGNDVVLDASLLGIPKAKSTTTSSFKVSLKKLAQKYCSASYKEIHIFSTELSDKTPYASPELSLSGESYLNFSVARLKNNSPNLVWNDEKKMLALEFLHKGKNHRVEAIYKIHFVENPAQETTQKTDSDF